MIHIKDPKTVKLFLGALCPNYVLKEYFSGKEIKEMRGIYKDYQMTMVKRPKSRASAHTLSTPEEYKEFLTLLKTSKEK